LTSGERDEREPLTSIVLRQARDEGGVRYLAATRRPDGGVHIEGQDLGRGVEQAYGPGLTEYEWDWSIEAAAVPALIAALDGQPGDDPLRVIDQWFNAHGQIDPGIHVKEAGVPIDFWNRIGD
jgi:hypothetical protein